MTLKDKTVSGLTWSFADNFIKLGLTFIVGIILARLLTPREFGLVGMIAIFIAVSQSFIDSGFTQALIRKQNCTQTDYSTVFFFNLAAGILLYFVLFFTAAPISNFFNEPQLELMVKVLGLGLIINSLTIVQRARLTKEINFKLQTKVSFISSFISGGIAIGLAYMGYGVWALVFYTLADFLFNALFLWLWNKWKPDFVFSRESFKSMFSFGSKLLASGLIDTAYRNIYLLVIGKFFSAAELGYFTRAEQFKNLPSQNISGVIQRVTYPVLSTIQDNKQQLKEAYKKIIKSTMLITFVLMAGMAAAAEPMIITLIGRKWQPSVIYLQMLCFVGMFYPLHALNLNMLKVQGRSDLFLKLEVIKKLLAVPAILLGIFYGIKIMILGMMFNTLIAYYLNSYWSGRFIGYSFTEQIRDILPAFVLALFIGLVVYYTGYIINVTNFVKLIVQIFTGLSLFFLIAEITKMENYLFIKNIVIDKLKKKSDPQG